jgi:uncharacterized integral membrane protein
MIRLFSIIVVFAVFLSFIILNLPNKCDISLGFMSFKDVPIFLSVLSSFVLGMLATIPMMLFRKKNKKLPLAPGPSKKAELKSGPNEIKKDDSPYGID